MQKWEYLRLDVMFLDEDSAEVKWIISNGVVVYPPKQKDAKLMMSDYLAEIGKQGWEMVSVYRKQPYTREIYYFKRPTDQ